MTVTSAVLDTSAYLDLGVLDPAVLPEQLVLTAVTVAELHAGVATARDEVTRARRREQLVAAVSDLDILPFGDSAAARYGTFVGLVVAAGRAPRRRQLDIMIAATASAAGLPVITRNPADLIGLEAALDVIAV